MSFRKVMAAMILGGILLTGVGAGICFAEWNGLEYQGHMIAGEENAQKKVLECHLDEEYDRLDFWTWDSLEGVEVIGDRSVPQDEIRIEVTYNPVYGEPELSDIYSDIAYQGTEKIKTGQFHIYLKSDNANTEEKIRLFLSVKDHALKDLKEHKFSTCEVAQVFKVRIETNPATAKLFLYR